MKAPGIFLLAATLLALSTFSCETREAKNDDQVFIDSLFQVALSEGQSYTYLTYLCKNIGPRLTASPNAYKAIFYGDSLFKSLGLDVNLQPVMVPHWVRGDKEVLQVMTDSGAIDLAVTALGSSVGTPTGGIMAPVIEVHDFEELNALGRKNIEGKIVFYNRRMRASLLQTFRAYGGAVNQRSQGASQAASYGAVGSIVRSMTLKKDQYPHTGNMRYDTTQPFIPNAAISTLDADRLQNLLAKQKDVQLFFRQNCEQRPDTLAWNVVGEWKGSENPDSYLIVGGHLDSWDLAEGAHDDGAGVAQAIEAIRLLKAMGYQPKNSIRVVWFMNEENGVMGGKAYADSARAKKEKHLAAIESDRGGFTPRGFTFETTPEQIAHFRVYSPLLASYGFSEWQEGGSGSDIEPLKGQGALLIGYFPDSQRYFDYHHAATDVLENVNERELELGAAGIAALLYLIDQHGL